MKTTRKVTKKCPCCGEEYEADENWAFDCCAECENKWNEIHSGKED